MSQTVQTVIKDWAVPRMNMHNLRGCFFVGNVGSQRVFERNNFEEIGSFKDWSPESPNKNRGKTSIVVMEWKGLL
jgi:RimJ/RimL family protein N-acetyltransferase